MRFSILAALAIAPATVFAAPAAAAGSLIGCFTGLTYIGSSWPPSGISYVGTGPQADCIAACKSYAYAAFFSATTGCDCFERGVFDTSAGKSVACNNQTIYVFQE